MTLHAILENKVKVYIAILDIFNYLVFHVFVQYNDLLFDYLLSPCSTMVVSFFFFYVILHLLVYNFIS